MANSDAVYLLLRRGLYQRPVAGESIIALQLPCSGQQTLGSNCAGGPGRYLDYRYFLPDLHVLLSLLVSSYDSLLVRFLYLFRYTGTLTDTGPGQWTDRKVASSTACSTSSWCIPSNISSRTSSVSTPHTSGLLAVEYPNLQYQLLARALQSSVPSPSANPNASPPSSCSSSAPSCLPPPSPVSQSRCSFSITQEKATLQLWPVTSKKYTSPVSPKSAEP